MPTMDGNPDEVGLAPVPRGGGIGRVILTAQQPRCNLPFTLTRHCLPLVKRGSVDFWCMGVKP